MLSLNFWKSSVIIETSNNCLGLFYLKFAPLNVHWERVELHRTNESDSSGQCVHQVVLVVDPDALLVVEAFIECYHYVAMLCYQYLGGNCFCGGLKVVETFIKFYRCTKQLFLRRFHSLNGFCSVQQTKGQYFIQFLFLSDF